MNLYSVIEVAQQAVDDLQADIEQAMADYEAEADGPKDSAEKLSKDMAFGDWCEVGRQKGILVKWLASLPYEYQVQVKRDDA